MAFFHRPRSGRIELEPEQRIEKSHQHDRRACQAGGLVTLLPDGTGHRCRYVPSKRADVARGLMQRFFGGLDYAILGRKL